MPTVVDSEIVSGTFADPSVVTLGITPAAGNTLLIAIRCGNVRVIVDVDDNLGTGTYVEDLNGDTSRVAIWRLSNIPSGITSLNIDITGGNTIATCAILEVSGLDNSSPLQDTSAWAALAGTGTARTIEYTTVAADELVFFMFYLDSSRVVTGTSGTTVIDEVSSTNFNGGWKLPTAAETDDVTFSPSPGSGGDGFLVSYSAAGGAYNAIPTIIQNYRNMGYK